MRYDAISPELFCRNRERLAARLPDDALAILHSSDLSWGSADSTHPFAQAPDLFYLTGIDQEETVLVLCPGHVDRSMRELLFVRETSDLIAIWEGKKVSREEASAISGITTVLWSSEFDLIWRRLMAQSRSVWLNHNEHSRSGAPVNFSLDDRFRQCCQDHWPDHCYRRLAPLLHDLRMVKQSEEIDLIQRACKITADGFRRLLSYIRPGVWEYQIEAELLHEFVRQGSKGFAYQPIIASGANSCVLHYITNDQVCRDGDLVLLDVAAEYANYKSDLTRTLPIGGKFTERQRAVYDAVHRILRLCIDHLIVPGKAIRSEYHLEVARAVEGELIALGLLDADQVAQERSTNLPEEERAYRRYFMHGTSHSLGLDVHDVTPVDPVFMEGMVVTVEPGIYIRDEGIGVRLENDVVVQSGGNLDLMAGIPIASEEIERLMSDGLSAPMT